MPSRHQCRARRHAVALDVEVGESKALAGEPVINDIGKGLDKGIQDAQKQLNKEQEKVNALSAEEQKCTEMAMADVSYEDELALGGAVETTAEAPATQAFEDFYRDEYASVARALVLAPPSAAGSPWLRRFGDFSDGLASGWMQVRGARRRRALDRGFVLSDHADWPALDTAISATGAERVIVTHGHVPVMVRWLNERGWRAQAFETEFDDEGEADALPVPAAPVSAAGAADAAVE